MGPEKDKEKMNDSSKGQIELAGSATGPADNKEKTALSLFIAQKSEKENFIFSRIKKLSTALYLITNIFPESEPIRYTLREKGLSLVTEVLVPDWSIGQRMDVLFGAGRIIHEIVTILELASGGKLISEINFSILKGECEFIFSLLSGLREEDVLGTGIPLMPEFFGDRKMGENSLLPVGKPGKRPFENKEQTIGHAPNQVFIKDNVKDKSFTTNKFNTGNLRKDSILRVVRREGEVTIKDITKFISNCSEKTIQRELLSLVSEGILKKAGQKRWSRYSFAG